MALRYIIRVHGTEDSVRELRPVPACQDVSLTRVSTASTVLDNILKALPELATSAASVLSSDLKCVDPHGRLINIAELVSARHIDLEAVQEVAPHAREVEAGMWVVDLHVSISAAAVASTAPGGFRTAARTPASAFRGAASGGASIDRVPTFSTDGGLLTSGGGGKASGGGGEVNSPPPNPPPQRHQPEGQEKDVITFTKNSIISLWPSELVTVLAEDGSKAVVRLLKKPSALLSHSRSGQIRVLSGDPTTSDHVRQMWVYELASFARAGFKWMGLAWNQAPNSSKGIRMGLVQRIEK